MDIGFHHLRKRILISHGLEPFPSSIAWKRKLDYLMYIVCFVAPAALIPQIFHIYTTKSGEGLALSTWLMLSIVNILWATYGAAHKDRHIIFANTLMAIFNGAIVVGILMY